jgi:hypothetical protein
MRLIQIAESADTYMDDLKDAVITLLSVTAAEGIDTIKTDQLIIDLRSLGFSVDIRGIFPVLDGMQIVANANKENIQLQIYDDAFSMNDDEKEAGRDAIDKKAKSMSTKDITK